MSTTELITAPQAPGPREPWSDERRDARLDAAPAEPTVGETLDETLPLVGAIPVYGPPVVFLAGPWLFLALMLAGPFALLVTFVVLLAAAAALVGLIGAVLAAPYLLVRHLRANRTDHASIRAPAGAAPRGGIAVSAP